MDRPAAIAALPEVYRSAIELRDVGASAEEIAERLELDVHAVPALLEIGEKKLARLLAAEDVPQPGPTLDAELAVGVVEMGLDGPG